MDSVICLLDSVSVMMATQGKTAIQVSFNTIYSYGG